MDADVDLVLTIGIILLVLSIPSLLSAWVEGRAPRLGSVMTIAALGMIVYALVTRPGGYAFNEVPGVMVKVIAGFFQ
jgi:formate-dependent nitrite reductase membrane component NrfD